MKHSCWLLLLLATATAGLVLLAGLRGEQRRVAAAPPLSLDGYRHEKLPEASKKKVKVKADNSPCYVCHANYDSEELVLAHAKQNIGCVKCHGDSYAHRNDEDNITPPDILYAEEMIGKACRECHETHDAPAVEVIARWQERCPAKEDPKTIVCTDCHGKHRLKFRTVWWDKKTRELVVREEGTVKYNPDYSKKKPKKNTGQGAEQG